MGSGKECPQPVIEPCHYTLGRCNETKASMPDNKQQAECSVGDEVENLIKSKRISVLGCYSMGSSAYKFIIEGGNIRLHFYVKEENQNSMRRLGPLICSRPQGHQTSFLQSRLWPLYLGSLQNETVGGEVRRCRKRLMDRGLVFSRKRRGGFVRVKLGRVKKQSGFYVKVEGDGLGQGPSEVQDAADVRDTSPR